MSDLNTWNKLGTTVQKQYSKYVRLMDIQNQKIIADDILQIIKTKCSDMSLPTILGLLEQVKDEIKNEDITN